jgi:tetratricopeptide (TPR) repeat protein
MLLNDLGACEEALVHGKTALALFRQVGANSSMMDMLARVALTLSHLGRLAEATAHTAEALELAQRLSNPWGLAHVRIVQAVIRFREGALDLALGAGREALSGWRTLEDREETARALLLLARILLRTGDLARAEARLSEATRVLAVSPNALLGVYARLIATDLLVQRGNTTGARVACQEAEVLRQRLGIALPPSDRAWHGALVSCLAAD